MWKFLIAKTNRNIAEIKVCDECGYSFKKLKISVHVFLYT